MNDEMFGLDRQSGIFIIYGHPLLFLLLLKKENEFFRFLFQLCVKFDCRV